MPRLGYDEIAPGYSHLSFSMFGWEYEVGYKVTATCDCIVDDIVAYIKLYDGDPSVAKCAIYDSNYSIIGNGKTNEIAISNTDYEWLTFTFDTKPTLSKGNDYYLVGYGYDNGDCQVILASNVGGDPGSGGGTVIYKDANNYPTWEDPLTDFSEIDDSPVSIYCNYTEINADGGMYTEGDGEMTTYGNGKITLY